MPPVAALQAPTFTTWNIVDMVNADAASPGEPHSVGILRGCALEILPGRLWRAQADLAIAGVFLDDPSPDALAGFTNGVAESLSHLRVAGLFSGNLCETLLISKPPVPLPADALLIVGLGTPDSVSAATVRRAFHMATEHVALLRVAHVACDFDAIWVHRSADSVMPLCAAALGGIEAGLRNGTGRLQRWSFLTSGCDAAALAGHFRSALDRDRDRSDGAA